MGIVAESGSGYLQLGKHLVRNLTPRMQANLLAECLLGQSNASRCDESES